MFRGKTGAVVLILVCVILSVSATDICADIICGDVNGDGMQYTVGDFVLLNRYLAGQAALPSPVENSDVDLCGSVNISDLALYAEMFVVGLSSGICQPREPCYLPTGENAVRLGCPVEVYAGEYDTFPLPVYLTTDTVTVAFSLGFSFSSDDIEFVSIDRTGSVLPENWFVTASTPADSNYIWPVADSNVVFVVGAISTSSVDGLPPQSDGLLCNIMMRNVSDSEQVIDFDSVFFEPAGEFLFSVLHGGSISPAYVDCGDADIFIRDYVCGDVNGSGAVDIDDAVYLIAYIFAGGPPPFDMDIADVDCSGGVDVDDVVYLLAYMFAGGPPPCDPDDDGTPDC